MNILVLGGTAWLGHQIASTALERGHRVTCLARGSGIPEGATLLRVDRDDPGALDTVAREHWDAVIDLASQPGHVRRAVAALEPVADRYLFVSSCSVYASQARIGADESEPTLDPLEADRMGSPADYGRAKVACERAVLEAFGVEHSLVVRAGLIGGPGDPSGRTTYWPWRFAHPSTVDGRVLVPDAPGLLTAMIDVRDLAAWLVQSAEGHRSGRTGAPSGVMNALGLPVGLGDLLDLVRSLAGHRGGVVAAPKRWLAQHDVAEWSGPRSLPLWLADPEWSGKSARSIDRALDAGLALRPLGQTVGDILTTQSEQPIGAGLTDDDERELLAELDRLAR